MEKNFRLIALAFSVAAAITLSSNTGICAQTEIQPVSKPVVTSTVASQYTDVNPLDLVANPQNYINQKVKFTGQFDKFSSIGLDYPPVNRSSKDYISFIIKRTDVDKDYNIPLSELKLILKRDKAEKLIDLESGDKIEVAGTVFSTALNDPWVDVDSVKMLNPKPAKKAEK